MTPGASESPRRYSILVVCTGNICRSPLAREMLLARLASAKLDIRVVSAGTAALVGQSMTRQALDLARQYGGAGGAGKPDSHHTSTALTAELVGDADLILTATREHSHAVAILHPRAARFTFPIVQFARFIENLSPIDLSAEQEHLVSEGDLYARLTSLVNEIAAQRGFVAPLADAALDDIEDPYQQSQETYDRVGVTLDGALQTIVHYLSAAKASQAP